MAPFLCLNIFMFKCNYLWNSMQILPDGRISPCCAFRNDLSSLMNDDDIHNSSTLVSARESALEDIIPLGCSNCAKRASYGDSRVAKSFIKFNNDSYTPTVDIENIQEIDLRMGNVCNFMCVMCTSEHSHLIAKEQGITKLSVWTKEQEDGIIEMLERATSLRVLTLAGGEPFYNKRLMLRILNATSAYSSNLAIKILTNCSIYDEDCVTALKKFKRVDFGVSIDSIGKMNELQRWKADNSVILDVMFKYYTSLKDNIVLNINPLITSLTITDLPELINYFEDMDEVDGIYVNFVNSHRHLRIDTIRKDVLNKVADELSEINSHKTSQFDKIVEHVYNVTSTPYCYDEIIKFSHDMKRARNMVFPETFFASLEK